MSASDFQEEEALEANYDRALVAWLLRYARGEWRALGGCLVLLLAVAAIQLAQPQIIRYAIDHALQPAGAASSARERAALLTALWPLVWLYAATVLASEGLGFAQIFWLRRTGQRIITHIRADTFDHLQTLSLSYFDSRPVGRVVTRVTNDVEALSEMYTSVLVNLFRDVFFIIGAAFMLLRLDVRIAFVAFAVVPLVIVTSIVFRRYSRVAWRNMRTRLARINATLAETFSGIRIVQAFGREAQGSTEFRAINEDFYQSAAYVIRVFAVFGPVLDLLTTTALAVIIWIGGAQVLAGTITFGTLYAATAYLRMLFNPINAVAEKYNILQAALAAAERLTELINTRPDIEDPSPDVVRALPPVRRTQAGALARSTVAAGPDQSGTSRPGDGVVVGTGVRGTADDVGVPAVTFDDVWFAYKEGDWVLRGVSFEVMPGETVAFVGHTGAGKSTIMNLVPRLYDVQRGAVRVDGVDVRHVAQPELHRRVGLVMQDVFLFAGTIAGNIDLGDPAIDRAAVEHAARTVGADAFIERLPQRYDEPVVERGLSLSAGQRQLISFARALAYDPEILILDEATASIDSETEESLQVATRAIARGRTTIVVAHRLATVRDANRIYVMHHGRIVDVGGHEELLAHDGLYRKLWELQFGDPTSLDGWATW
jgi:ATP-binding cassette, subfamily B, multidrug efflux pump